MVLWSWSAGELERSATSTSSCFLNMSVIHRYSVCRYLRRSVTTMAYKLLKIRTDSACQQGCIRAPMLVVYLISLVGLTAVLTWLDRTSRLRFGWVVWCIWVIMGFLVSFALREGLFPTQPWWRAVLIGFVLGPLWYWRAQELHRRQQQAKRRANGRQNR